MASYNESRAIVPVLAEIDEAARALAPSGIELSVVLVDDSSPDGTAEVAISVAKQLGLDFEVLTGERRGVGEAMSRGFTHALRNDDVDFLITLDADGQHDGRQIPDLVRAFLARGSGITIGSRWTRGGSSPGTSRYRTVLSKTGNALVRRITGLRGVRDATTSFRVYTPEVARLLRPETLLVEGYGFFSAFIAIAQAHGYSIDEVPITFRPRYSGLSKLRRSDIIEFARNLLPVRRQVEEIRREMRSDQTQWAQRSTRMRAQESTNSSSFGATEELANLASADRFLTWIHDEINPYLGHHVLEVGAGIGSIARKLAQSQPDRTIVAVEPADNVFSELAGNTADLANVEALQLTSQDLLDSGRSGTFDSVVYVSVLEHILDDTAELDTAYRLLAPGGTLALFVPAMPSLYGSLDFKSGHYRRYDKPLLRSVVERAGFEIVRLRYLDVAGVAPYWLMYRLFNRQSLDAGSSKVFDSLIVPASKTIQRAVPNPPRGKNLVAIARRR
jgi:glycosyltransferase involved in cell wall biosynthesis/2-polyprenyl-3-methyl-5-hydroxy-6-metoxy-1,4-benzoquinol methylase